MPDWSYQTIFRPLLFLLTAERSRALALTAMGTLARLPAGTRLIDLMGHMMPPRELARTIGSMHVASPVGLGAGLDPYLQATDAFDRFGFGFLEIGPVTLQPLAAAKHVQRVPELEAIVDPDPLANPGLLASLKRLDKRRAYNKHHPNAARLFGTLGHKPGALPREAAMEQCFLMQSLAPHCTAFILDTRYTLTTCSWSDEEWLEYVESLLAMREQSCLSHPLFLSLAPDLPWAEASRLISLALSHGFFGIEVGGGCAFGENGRLHGGPVFAHTLEMVQRVRSSFGDDIPLIAGGGVIEPVQALQLLAGGADLLTLKSGLVYAGPGLPKRVNEAILDQVEHRQTRPEQREPDLGKSFAPRWLSGIVLGSGMIVAGALAWIVALTVVLLPYDESFLGMPATALHHLNERLLHFLSHDRISLAGTMISIGVMYVQLSFWALRRQERWARQILLASGAIGFASLFYFWGFGYFDPAHALLSLILFPFFLHAVAKKRSNRPHVPIPDLQNDSVWRFGLWGQLCFVMIGCGLLGAGIVISLIGMTTVFVPQDLAFMQTTADLLRAAHPRLLPLIAHDRAGFGGALVADGIAVLLLSLWGFRRGSRWIWWTLLLAGVPGFVAGIGIHFMVGYVDWWHLLPAYVAVAIFAAGLICCRPYLCAKR
ncbi:dihydroorotate dehydrogenase [Brevibacillus fluminis]|uniref:dihydroorotate dehydrogenase n=1 Tax=Brevibacillus fluminis TaxID=511487 RepID=UPI003F8B51BC